MLLVGEAPPLNLGVMIALILDLNVRQDSRTPIAGGRRAFDVASEQS